VGTGIVFVVLVVASFVFLVWCNTTDKGERFKAEWWPDLMELFAAISEARGQWKRERPDSHSNVDDD
jgi:hypothetical protein